MMNFIATIGAVQTIKTALLILAFIIAVIIVLYNWLYLVRMVSSFDQTDLSPPKWIERLVKASIFTALITVFLILILFLTHYY